MTSYKKIDIKFYTTDEIYNMEKNNALKLIDLKKVGVTSNANVILSNLLYKKHQIIKKPYHIKIDSKSFDKNRLVLIKYILESIALRKQKGNSEATIRRFKKVFCHFIYWLDSNELEFPINKKEARTIFYEYVFYLKSIIKTGECASSYAHSLFLVISYMLKDIFEDKEDFITAGISPIVYKQGKKTEKNSESEIIYSFNFYYHLFNQLSDFLIKEKQYPFLLKLPNQELWIIPSRLWLKTEESEYYLKSYDYKTGQIRSAKEIKEAYRFNDEKTAYDYRNSFMYRLHENNINTKTNTRMFLGRVALKAYFMHFLAITGMNDSTAATLAWNDDFTIEKEQQNFRNIKYRAQNKLVEFRIQKEFMNEFNKYIKLRKYLLDGNNFDYLFFSHDRKNAMLSVAQQRGTFSSTINQYMKKTIDKNLPIINSKQNRVNKIQSILKNDGLIAAADLAQNLATTVISNYLGVSEEQTLNEFSEYFEKLNKTIIFNEDQGNNIEIGQCDNLDQPHSEIKLKSFNTNCKQQEGCLFCDKYGIHADEKDIRKLYSLEFIINESKYLVVEENEFQKVYGNILNRISNIIDELIKQNPLIKGTVTKIRKEVYEKEKLTPYFEKKLILLHELGILK